MADHQIDQMGRYEILALLGQGGMGIVYHARDPRLQRDVALKVIKLPAPLISSQGSSGAAEPDQKARRFAKEVQLAAQLNHPHIITIYDVDLEHEPPYLVMELLHGGTLAERLAQGPLSWSEALAMLRPLVQALVYAHRQGIIHRDLKPANVMFAKNQTADQAGETDEGPILKLVDFGLARREGLEDTTLTATGVLVGTPAYMSPEQVQGDLILDARTDIFSLGLILLEAITGHNPLRKSSSIATIAEIISPKPVDIGLLRQQAPPAIIDLIERAVVKDREARYPNCETLLADLDRCLTGPASSPSGFDKASADRPQILVAYGIDLDEESRAVLKVLFKEYGQISVEVEFGRGLAKTRVFRIQPLGTGRNELPVVAKVGPPGLMQQEWRAYQAWVKNTLYGVAEIEGPPQSGAGTDWKGLRYKLVGGGIFDPRSLHDYYNQASSLSEREGKG